MYDFLWAYSAWNKLFYSILFLLTEFKMAATNNAVFGDKVPIFR